MSISFLLQLMLNHSTDEEEVKKKKKFILELEISRAIINME
jgi:hypothetical protein